MVRDPFYVVGAGAR